MDLEGSPGPLHECHLLDCSTVLEVGSHSLMIWYFLLLSFKVKNMHYLGFVISYWGDFIYFLFGKDHKCHGISIYRSTSNTCTVYSSLVPVFKYGFALFYYIYQYLGGKGVKKQKTSTITFCFYNMNWNT